MLHLEQLENRCLLSLSSMLLVDGNLAPINNNDTVDFDSVIVGVTKPALLTITNIDDGVGPDETSVIIDSITIDGTDSDSFLNSTLELPLTLGLGESLEIPFAFRPFVVDTDFSAAINITSDAPAPDDALSFALTGDSTNPNQDIAVEDSAAPADNMDITFEYPEGIAVGSNMFQQAQIAGGYILADYDPAQTHYVTLTNNSGETITVEKPQLDSDNFFAEYANGIHTPYDYYERIGTDGVGYTINNHFLPGYVNELEIGEFFTGDIMTEAMVGGQPITRPYSWYSFQAEQGQSLDVYTRMANITHLSLYNQYGSMINDTALILPNLHQEDPNALLHIDSMVAPYTGTYFLTVTGEVNMNSDAYQLLVTESYSTPTSLEYDAERTEGTVGSSFSERTMDWYTFQGEYGDTISLKFLTEKDYYKEHMMAEFTILNPNGEIIYHNDQMYFDESTDEDITLYADGTYYIQIASPDLRTIVEDISLYATGESSRPWTIIEEPNDIFILLEEMEDYTTTTTDYTLQISKTGSILELEPGQSVDVPVWFIPSVPGTISEDMNIYTTLTDTPITISLNGQVQAADLAVSEVYFPENFDQQFVQAGKPLTVSFDVTNDSDAHVLTSTLADIYIVQYDGNDNIIDELLLETVDGNPIIVDSLLSGDTETYTTDVIIPVDLNGEYKLIVKVDSPEELEELIEDNNVAESKDLYIDPYNIIMTDSYDVRMDRYIDYGIVPIGNIYEGYYVQIQNRGSEPALILDYGLTSDDNPDYDSPFTLQLYDIDPLHPLELKPGEARRFWVNFTPSEFNAESGATFTDSMFVLTDEIDPLDDNPYIFTLDGEVSGTDLIVEETSGANADDDVIDYDYDYRDIRPSLLNPDEMDTLPVQYFNMTNNGNLPLYINKVRMESSDSVYTIKLVGGNGELLPVSLPFTLQTSDSGLSTQQFAILFAPESVGTYEDTIIINSNDQDQSFTYKVDVSATAVEPIITVHETADNIDDDLVNFGYQPLYSAIDKPILQKIEVENTGSADMTVDSLEGLTTFSVFDNVETLENLGLINAGDTIITTAGGITIAPGESAYIFVQFKAEATGFYSETLTINNNTATEPIYDLTVKGFADEATIEIVNPNFIVNTSGTIQISPVNVNTDNADMAKDTWFYIHNGAVSNTLKTISIPNSHFSLSAANATQIDNMLVFSNADGSPVVLEPGQTIRINVSFDAASYTTSDFDNAIDRIININEEIVIDSNAPDETLAVKTTLTTPEMDIDTAVAFDTTNFHNSNQQIVTVTNSGSSDLVLSDIDINGGQTVASQFTIVSASNLTIAPGSSADIVLKYTPTIMGISQAQLVLDTNDLDESSMIISLEGNSNGLPIYVSEEDAGKYTYVDEDGDLVTLSLSEGSFTIYFEDGMMDNANISTIVLDGTSDKAKLKIKTRGETTIGSIETTTTEGYNSLSQIVAPNVSIGSAINIDGSLTKLQVGSILAGASVNVAYPSSKPMTIKAEQIAENVTFDLASEVKTFQAEEFLSGSLTARDLNKIKIAGDLGASISINSVLEDSGTIGSVSVKGSITGDIDAINSIKKIAAGESINADITSLTGSISKVSAKENISGSILALNDISKLSAKGDLSATIRAQNIKSIKANAMNDTIVSVDDIISKVSVKTDIIDSHLLAGYDIGMDGLASANDEHSAGMIGKVQFGGTFRDSFVTAGAITDDVLLSLGMGASGQEVISDDLGSIGKIKGRYIEASGELKFGFYSAGEVDDSILDLINQSNEDYVEYRPNL